MSYVIIQNPGQSTIAIYGLCHLCGLCLESFFTCFQRAYRSMILMIQNLWTVPQVLRFHLIPHQSHWKHGLRNYAVKSQFRLSSYGTQWVLSLTQEELCTLQDWGAIFWKVWTEIRCGSLVDLQCDLHTKFPFFYFFFFSLRIKIEQNH